MDKIDYNDIEDLLKEIEPLIQQQEIIMGERLKRGELFNIFDTLGVEHYEVKHSAIIANLLDPNASHGQKDKFLKLFLAEVGDGTRIDTSHSNVYTEFSIDNGRVDIFIVNKVQKKVIIIENKINAGDQEKQLKRYSEFNDGDVALYYLTLDGKKASEYSTGKKNIKYKSISYSRNILNWIENCIKESATTPLIRETLVQYKNLIKKLTNNLTDIGMNENLLKIMAKHPKAVKAIYDAQNEFVEYVYRKNVKPAFEKFAKENNLVFDGENYEVFHFYKEEWRSSTMAISIYKDTGVSYLKLGISSPETKKFKKNVKLDCLTCSPDDDFPFGYEKICVNMAQGNFAKNITELVSNILNELEKKEINNFKISCKRKGYYEVTFVEER